MKTSLFDFPLPTERIALRPAHPRDSARMLVVDDALHDRMVRELPEWLKPGDILVFNDTRVLPARLFGKRGEAGIEILLHKCIAGAKWLAFAKPAKKLRVGDNVQFSEALSAEVTEKRDDGQVVLTFACDEASLRAALEQHGQVPLPPYIEKQRAADARDKVDYQTMYAAPGKEASVAAPTAGLHFTPALLEAVKTKGVHTAFVTLHVGGGTFLPVKAEDTREHVMHSEYLEVSAETAGAINVAKANGGRVVAVGTTSLRVLESVADATGRVLPFSGETDIFITPGYRFKCVDMLLTNFHLPKSTLFMLVSAFSGRERMLEAYAHAIEQEYRFYSYGDACLLTRI